MQHELAELILQDPRTLTLAEVLIYAAGGLLGALVKEIFSKEGALLLPRVVDGRLHLGFLASLVPGMILAVLADGNFLTAFGSGFAASTLADKWVNRPAKVQKRLSQRQVGEAVQDRIRALEERDAE